MGHFDVVRKFIFVDVCENIKTDKSEIFSSNLLHLSHSKKLLLLLATKLITVKYEPSARTDKRQ